jgi:Glycine rich protein
VRILDSSGYALCVYAATAMLTGCGGNAGSVVIAIPGNGAGNVLPYQHTFKYTDPRQSFKVPTGVTKITVVARGAAGAGETGSCGAEYFGRGGRVYAVIPVRPGERLYVYVGGQGSYATGGLNAGGSPGSGNSFVGYGGGGASDVREGGHTLSDRILVAGGGGGQGRGSGAAYGGAGGGSIGGEGGSSVLLRVAVAAAPAAPRVRADRVGLVARGMRMGLPEARELWAREATAARAATIPAVMMETLVGPAAATTAAVAAVAAAPFLQASTADPAVAVAADHRTSSPAPQSSRRGKAGKMRLATGSSSLVGSERSI